MLRDVFVLDSEEVTGDWRKLHDEELHDLCCSPNIRDMKPRRIRWVGHVACVEEKRNAYRCKSDVWLTVHRNSVWIRKTNWMSLLCYPLFLFYKLLNIFQATMCPSSGADDSIVLSPCVGVVPWLQEGCQNRLAGSY